MSQRRTIYLEITPLANSKFQRSSDVKCGKFHKKGLLFIKRLTVLIEFWFGVIFWSENCCGLCANCTQTSSVCKTDTSARPFNYPDKVFSESALYEIHLLYVIHKEPQRGRYMQIPLLKFIWPCLRTLLSNLKQGACCSANRVSLCSAAQQSDDVFSNFSQELQNFF